MLTRSIVESLEVRRLLSTVTWTGGGNDHLWSDVANWSTGAEPGQHDDVIIPAGDPTPIKAQPAVPTTLHTLTSAIRLQTAGSLTVAGAAQFNAGLDIQGGMLLLNGLSTTTDFSLSGGAIAGAGQLAAASASAWSGGTMALSQVTANAGLSFSGNSMQLAVGKLILPAGQISTLTGTLMLTTGASLSNAGTLTLNNATIVTNNDLATVERFFNSGTINSLSTTQNPGNTIGNSGGITTDLLFSNSGDVEVGSGGLRFLSPDDGNTTGTFGVAAGCLLMFASAYNFAPSSTIAGAGVLDLFSAPVTVSGAVNVATTNCFGIVNVTPSGSPQNFGDLTLTVQGSFTDNTTSDLKLNSLTLLSGTFTTKGTLTVAGELTWSNTVLTATNIVANGAMNIGGFNTTMNGGTLTIRSGQTLGIAQGQLKLLGGATVANLGTLTLQDASLVYLGTVGDALLNAGVFNSKGTVSVPTVINSGTVNVINGNLSIAGGSNSIAGSQYTIAAGAALTMAADANFAAGSSISGAGQVSFGGNTIVGGAYNITGSTSFGSANVTFTSNVAGLGAIANTPIAGSINFLGTVPTSMSSLKIIGMVNFGQNDVTLNGLDLNANGFGIQGSGTLTIQGPFTWEWGEITGLNVVANGGIQFNGTHFVALNNATLVNPAGQTSTFGTNGALTFNLNGISTFENDGTLNALTGTVAAPTGAFSKATFINRGSIILSGMHPVFRLDIPFDNYGLLDVQTGIFIADYGDDGDSTGTYNADSGARLALSTSGVWDLGPATTITGAGEHNFGGNFTVEGNYQATGPVVVTYGSLNLENNSPTIASLYLLGTTLAGNGTLTVTGLTTLDDATVNIHQLIAGGGTSIIGSTSSATFGGNSTFINAAGQTTTVDASHPFTIFTNGTATLVNNGTWSAANLQVVAAVGSSASFVNNGEFDVVPATTGSNAVSFPGGFSFTNSGLVHITKGALTLGGSSHSTAGASFVTNNGTALNFAGSSHTLDAGATITGSGGITVTSELDMNGPQSLNGPALTISGGGIVRQLSAGSTNIVAAFTLTGGTFDLSGGALLIKYTTDPLATVRGYLQNGYNAGLWTGTPTPATGVIISTAAAANPLEFSIGYADSADAFNPAGLPANTIELRYTVIGDTNLDGTVGGADYAAVVQNYNTGTKWDQGDVTYGIKTGGADYAAVVQHYGHSVTSPAPVPSATPTASAAPSPSAQPPTAAIVATASASLLPDEVKPKTAVKVKHKTRR